MTYGNTTYYYVTDANKNVVCLLSGYSSAADYQYGPWGEIREAEGIAADWNPFRFSSEFYDDETGLVYYNYRYYSPALGRWLSRDPIGENGGANLYIMCKNNVLFFNDIRGLFESGKRYEMMNSNLYKSRHDNDDKIITSVIDFEKELEEEKYIVDMGIPLGHSDFTRGYPHKFINGEQWFDFTLEDIDSKTSPNPFWGEPKNHFQDLSSSNDQIATAIGIEFIIQKKSGEDIDVSYFKEKNLKCDANEFERAMHRMQDYFTHYEKGFRWDPFNPMEKDIGLGHGITSFMYIITMGIIENPDHDEKAWERANTLTEKWLSVYDCFCKNKK